MSDLNFWVMWSFFGAILGGSYYLRVMLFSHDLADGNKDMFDIFVSGMKYILAGAIGGALIGEMYKSGLLEKTS